MLVQLAIIVLGLYFVYRALSSPSSHAIGAGKKVGLVLFVIIMVVSVLFPDITTWMASIAGVGRGADLILYGVAGAFLFYVLTQYLQQQKRRDMLYRLARRVALLEANARYPQR